MIGLGTEWLSSPEGLHTYSSTFYKDKISEALAAPLEKDVRQIQGIVNKKVFLLYYKAIGKELLYQAMRELQSYFNR